MNRPINAKEQKGTLTVEDVISDDFFNFINEEELEEAYA